VHGSECRARSVSQLKILMSLLDDDGNGQLNPHELIDVFDGINNDALSLKDCNGKSAPHHWLGDGYCDKGKDGHQGGKASGDFNCNIFRCDDGDCGKPGSCRIVKGRDQITLVADGKQNFGHVTDRTGQIFEVDLKKGVKYYIWTSIDKKTRHHLQDSFLTLIASDGKTILKKGSDGPKGPQNSYMEYTPTGNIARGTIKVTAAHAGHRGSFIIQVSTKKPKL
jgi:hypothetical protein